MAREHARIFVSIWEESSDFTSLTQAEQWTYFAILSSQDLTWCGSMPYLPQRLALLSKDGSAQKSTKAIDGLKRRGYLLVDARTAEIAVRTFVRHDGVVKQPNVLCAAIKAWGKVHSEPIRDGLLVEFGKAFAEGFPEGFPDGFVRAFGRSFPDGFPDGFAEGFANSPSPFPLPPSPFLTTLGQCRTESAAPPRETAPTPEPTEEDEPKEKPTPNKRGTRLSPDFIPSDSARQSILTECPSVDLMREHAKFVDYWIAQPSSKGIKVDWDATWRNWMRRAGETSTRANGRQRETDDLFGRAMARANARDIAAGIQPTELLAIEGNVL